MCIFFCWCAVPPNISQALQRHYVQAITSLVPYTVAGSLLERDIIISYATDLSFVEKNVSVKLVACWTTDHQHSRKALIVIILMLWGECCKTIVKENCSTD